MVDLAKLVVRLEAENSRLHKDLDKSHGRLKKFERQTETISKSIKSTFASAFAGAFSVAAITGVARGITNVALETGRLRASLETVTGSAGAANAAFDKIKQFTSETPFQVNEVADAFIKLAAYGIEPTDDLLRSLGNTASAMGKTLGDAVEAISDAATGEFERLKEFGIKASSEGDRVAFTFRGVTTEVGKNADEITRYLQNIGNTDFAGAMERQMSTLGGAFSNFGDAIFSLTDKFASESGFTESVRDATSAITDLINKSTDGELAVTKFGKGLGIAIGNFAVGDSSVKGQRLQRIEELEEAEARLENQLRNRRSRRSAQEREELQQRLGNTRALIKTLKESLNAPEFERINNESLAARLPETAQVLSGPIVPAVPKSSQTSSKKKTGKSAAEREAESFAKSLQTLQDRLDPVSAKTRDYLESVALLDRAWADGAISGERHQELMSQLATDVEAVREAEEALTADRERALALIKDLDPGAQYRDQIADIQRLRDQFPELADALAEVELAAQIAWDEVGRGAEEAAEKTKSAWEELGPTFSSAFEDAIVEGKKFSDVLKGLEQDIIRIITRKAVTEPLGNAIGGLFGGGGGSSFLSGIFGNLFGGARAAGGPVSAGSAYLVGEHGPELFMPRGSGDIMTAKQTARAMGVNTYNFTFALPSDSIDHRRTAQQVAREAARYMQIAQGAV